MKYIALLRGINVGGKNSIKMVALRATFENIGLRDVTTFIQSGNVVFSAPAGDIEALCKKIERALFETFHYAALVVLIKRTDLIKVIKSAPKGFGSKPTVYRYNVLFLKKPITAKQVMKDIPRKEGVDEVYAGPGVIYFSNLIAKATQSRLSKIVALPMYRSLTIRNWNTTQKLQTIGEGTDVNKLLVPLGKSRKKPGTCSRGHAYKKTKALPVCPKCWPGYYKKSAIRKNKK